MIQRILGVLMLNAATYEEIEHDQSATTEAAIVVAIVALISGVVGGAISSAMGSGSFFTTLIFNVVMAFVSWIIWSFVTYFVGTSLFGGKADLGEMLRVLGYAQAPGILGFIPVIGACIGGVWTLATAFVAIRQGLDVDNMKALMTAIVAFVAMMIVSAVLSSVLGIGALGAGALSGALGS